MVTAWVAPGGPAPKVANIKRPFVSSVHASAIVVLIGSAVIYYLLSKGSFSIGAFTTGSVSHAHDSAKLELKFSQKPSDCSDCEDSHVNTNSPGVEEVTDEEFENDEEVKKIKEKMREEVESQATELGPSVFIDEVEWRSHAIKDPNTLQERVKGALMGAYLADAASLGLQGVDGPDAVRKLVEGRKRKIPDFYKPAITPYEAASGAFSAWGYEALPLLQSLLSSNKMDGYQFSQVTMEYFMKYPGHINEVPKAVVARLVAGKAWPYCGVSIDSASSLVKVPVVMARYAGTPDLSSMVEDGVRVHQSHPDALSAAQAFAAILERIVVLNSTVKESAEWAVDPEHLDNTARVWVKDVLDHAGLSLEGAVERWGTASKSGQVLQLALYIGMQHDDYQEAVRLNMFAGGDVTARAHVVGALLGARHGYASVPKRWRKKANRRLELEQMVQMLLYQRTAVLPVALGGGPGQES
eukprot:jgi/Botrbrau1/3416/Bobra.0337s0049.1